MEISLLCLSRDGGALGFVVRRRQLVVHIDDLVAPSQKRSFESVVSYLLGRVVASDAARELCWVMKISK